LLDKNKLYSFLCYCVSWYADSGHNSCSESGIDNVKASDTEKVTKVCSGLFWGFAGFCLCQEVFIPLILLCFVTLKLIFLQAREIGDTEGQLDEKTRSSELIDINREFVALSALSVLWTMKGFFLCTLVDNEI